MTLKTLLAFACSLLTAVPAALAEAPAKHPITHEDVWLAKRLGAPAVSPDGRWAVFPVEEPAYDEDSKVSDLWLVPTDGSTPARRITSSKAAESGVAWSADSRRIAFSTKRESDDVAQVYVLDLAAGGEARRVTSLVTGARSPRFSPDGTQLLYSSDVYPGARSVADNKRLADERKARKYNARAYDGFPIRNWDQWLEDRRPTLFVQPIDGTAADARDLLSATTLARSPGFAGIVSDAGTTLDAEWSPDGQSVVFVASTDRDKAAYALTNRDLYVVAATGGEPRKLTSGGDWSSPKFSADGATLYAKYEPRTRYTYNATRLAAVPFPAGGNARVLTASLDRSVSNYAISPDGRELWFLAEDAGQEVLYAVPADGGAARVVSRPASGVYGGLSVGGTGAQPGVVATWDTAVNPPEIVRIDPASGAQRALTSFNTARASAIDWQPAQHFWFTSRRGRRIHNMIVLPPGFDPAKRYPLFVVIHGGPHTMFRDSFGIRWNYHLLAAPGYVVLLTNYQGSTGFGEKFAQTIQGDPLKGPGDDVNEAADEAIRRYAFIDGSRQCAGGASYGGHLSNWLQATTTRYRCLVSHAGLVNLESQWGTSDTIYSRELNNGGPPWEQGRIWREQNPIRYAARFRTPALVTVGERDFRVPLNNSLEYWSVLQRMQVPSRLVVFPDENHWVLKGENSRYFYSEIHAWLARWLKP